MKHEIVVLDGYALNPGDLSWDGLKDFGNLTVYDYTADNQIIDRIQKATIVLTNKTPLSKPTIDAAQQLAYIGVMATGYDEVDVQYAHEKGIIVTNVPAYSTYSVAQMTFALLFEICHRVGHHDREVHTGRWSAQRDFCFWDFPGIELKDKTIGVVGFGQIGSKVAAIAHLLGMHVLAYTRNPTSKTGVDFVSFVDLEKLFASSDIISFHIPASSETKNLVDRTSIAHMKKGVILINTARGTLFDEQAVAEALHAGHIQAAGIDVMVQEPPHEQNVLLQAPNCIITPHIAWGTTEARIRCLEISIMNVKSFVHGISEHVV
jgi:glycerate dehydrogenase